MCIAALGTGVSMAYLTDYDSAVNAFTVGKVDIELTEPHWDPEDGEELEPSEEVEKDPQITNIGQNEAFVYLEISVPMADVMTAAADGSRLPKSMQELFAFTASDDWTSISEKTVGSSQVYTYAYNKILKPQETTSALFQTVTFANIIEGQLDTQSFQMPIRAYAIQTANTGGESESIPDQAKTAYEKYVNQNDGQDGKATR